MKTYGHILLAALTLFGFSACSNDDPETTGLSIDPVGVTYTLYASEGGGADDSRVTISGDSFTEVAWETGDVLRLTSAGGASAVLTASDSGKAVPFTGSGSEGSEIDDYCAAYAAESLTGTTAIFRFAQQDGTQQSAARLTGYAEQMSRDEIVMTLRPVGALLHVRVTGIQTLQSATFSAYDDGTNGTTLCDILYFDAAKESVSAEGETACYRIDNPDPAGFFLALPPELEMKSGWVLNLTDKAGQTQSLAYTDKTFHRGETTCLDIEWAVPTLTLGARTSYSWYEAGNSSTANGCDAETIYFDGACTTYVSNLQKAMISSACFRVKPSSSEEWTTYSATIGAKSEQGVPLTMKNLTGLDWASYDVEACVVTKAGATLTASKKLYITGLPYEHSFVGKNSEGWELTNVEWSLGLSIYTYKEVLELVSETNVANDGFAVSPRFNIPSNRNISTAVSTMAYQYDSNSFNYGTWDIWIAPTSDTQTRPLATNPHQKKGTNSMAGRNGGYEMVDNFYLTETLPYVCIAHNGVSTRNNTHRYAVIYSISVKYGE